MSLLKWEECYLRHALMSKKWGRGPENCECRSGLWQCVSTEQSVIEFWRLNHDIERKQYHDR